MEFKFVPKPNCIEGEISFSEEPFCEHCGTLEDYDAMISDGGTYWCVDCMRSMEEIPQDVLDEIERLAKEYKVRYYKDKLSELE